VDTSIGGPEPCLHLHFADHDGVGGRQLRWLFIQEMVGNGVFTLGAFLLCHSHSEEDLQHIVDACERSLQVVRLALDRKTTQGLLHPKVFQALEQG